jgi:hypothetical protein
MATQNNENSFPVDHPELSDTESDQEGKILETHAITTKVHEMKVKGFHLVEKKQQTLVDPKASEMPKMTILIHSRSISTDDPSIDDRCYVVQENITDGEVIRTEGKKYLDQNETEMTQEEVKRFEEDWSKLWKPRAELY